MTPTINIHEAAEAEINEAADFYDIESPGLGTVFIDEIQRAIENMINHTKAYQLI
jgi:hypothetical protein